MRRSSWSAHNRFSSAAARKETVAAQLVSLNEIEQLAKAGRLEAMSEKTILVKRILYLTELTIRAVRKLQHISDFKNGFNILRFSRLFLKFFPKPADMYGQCGRG